MCPSFFRARPKVVIPRGRLDNPDKEDLLSINCRVGWSLFPDGVQKLGGSIEIRMHSYSYNLNIMIC